MIDWVRVGAELMIFGSEANIHTINVVDLVFKNAGGEPVVIWGLMILQSTFMLGSTIWPKNSMVKTVCAVGIIGLALTMFSIFCAQLFLNPRTSYDIGLSEEAVRAITWVLISLYTLVNYVIAYFRYREIELIQRW